MYGAASSEYRKIKLIKIFIDEYGVSLYMLTPLHIAESSTHDAYQTESRKIAREARAKPIKKFAAEFGRRQY